VSGVLGGMMPFSKPIIIFDSVVMTVVPSQQAE
jgi:hypothetical protein